MTRFLIAGALFGGAAVGEVVLLGRSSPTSWWLIVGATVLVAVLLWRLRGPIDRLAHRLADGENAVGYRSMRELLQRMVTSLPIDEVVPQLAETMARTARSPRAEVRITMEDGETWTQAWPPLAEKRNEPLTVEIRHLGDHVGDVEIESSDSGFADRDRQLLDELVGPAGLALSTVRLTYTLRGRRDRLRALTESLRASQRRLIGVGLSEQQRLRVEIDERVRPHLIAAAAALTGAAETSAALDVAGDHLAVALDRLRELARGIYPARLGDAGLEVALESYLDQVGLTGNLRVSNPDQRLRSRPGVETCVYFCLVTALRALADTGVDGIDVFLTTTDDAVQFGIRAHLGSVGSVVAESALLAVRDRVEAFGGNLTPPDSDDTAFALLARVPLDQPDNPGPARENEDR